MARIKEHFGFDCSGDIRDYTIDDRDYLVTMVNRHKILRWRNQSLTASEYLKFSEIFGPCWTNDDPTMLGGNGESQAKHNDSNKVTLVSNKGGVLGDYEVSWHSDVSHKPYYTKGGTTPFRLLYAVKLPTDEQTITSWLDCEYVYNHCPEELKNKIEDLKIFSTAPYKTSWLGNVMPFVNIDPITGNKSLTIQREFFQNFMKVSKEDSKIIMDQLFEIALNPENVIVNEWVEGDVVLSNNYNTIHQRDKFTSTQERTLWRTTFQIEELVPLRIKPDTF